MWQAKANPKEPLGGCDEIHQCNSVKQDSSEFRLPGNMDYCSVNCIVLHVPHLDLQFAAISAQGRPSLGRHFEDKNLIVTFLAHDPLHHPPMN